MHSPALHHTSSTLPSSSQILSPSLLHSINSKQSSSYSRQQKCCSSVASELKLFQNLWNTRQAWILLFFLPKYTNALLFVFLIPQSCLLYSDMCAWNKMLKGAGADGLAPQFWYLIKKTSLTKLWHGAWSCRFVVVKVNRYYLLQKSGLLCDSLWPYRYRYIQLNDCFNLITIDFTLKLAIYD